MLIVLSLQSEHTNSTIAHILMLISYGKWDVLDATRHHFSNCTFAPYFEGAFMLRLVCAREHWETFRQPTNSKLNLKSFHARLLLFCCVFCRWHFPRHFCLFLLAFIWKKILCFTAAMYISIIPGASHSFIRCETLLHTNGRREGKDGTILLKCESNFAYCPSSEQTEQQEGKKRIAPESSLKYIIISKSCLLITKVSFFFSPSSVDIFPLSMVHIREPVDKMNKYVRQCDAMCATDYIFEFAYEL